MESGLGPFESDSEISKLRVDNMAGREGLEPPTTGSEDQCSIQTELTARSF